MEIIKGKQVKYIPIVIRKTGKKLIPDFPFETERGDTIIIAQEIMSWEHTLGLTTTFKSLSVDGKLISE